MLSCCTSSSGRGVSVESGDGETGNSQNSVSLRQVINVDSRPACEAPRVFLPQGISIVALAWFEVEPCPNLAYPQRYDVRKTRREVVVSRKSNLGYTKPTTINPFSKPVRVMNCQRVGTVRIGTR